MKKYMLFGVLASVFALDAYAVTSTVTSKDYVDTEVAKKQNTIPAAGANTGTAGTAVVTYTDTAGTVGERGIYDGSGTYNSTNDANKLATASALNSAINNLPTIETSKLTCYDSPDCTLWTVSDQEVYGEDND